MLWRLGLHCSGFSCYRAQSLELSVIVAHGLLSSTGSVAVAHGFSRPVACGIFPDQGSNLCPLHWQENSYHCPTRKPPPHLLYPFIFRLSFKLLLWCLNSSDCKESACNAGDPGSIPGSRSPGEGHGCPLQYSCPENSMNRGRGALWATVHGVAKSRTRLHS